MKSSGFRRSLADRPAQIWTKISSQYFSSYKFRVVVRTDSSDTGAVGVMGGLGHTGDALGSSRGAATTTEARGWGSCAPRCSVTFLVSFTTQKVMRKYWRTKK